MKTFLIIGALIGATVLAYRNTLPGDFIYDDHAIIVHNPLIRDLKNIPLILKNSYWGTFIGQPKDYKGGLYRPLTLITFALNFKVGGLSPRGYHLANLALHVGVSILLGLLALRLGMTWQGASAAMFLFALLPVHTEAVSNVVGRSEVLAAFFVLLAWIFATMTSRYAAIILGALSFGLALLSKENAAAFLPILFLSDYVTHQKPWKTLFRGRLLVWVVYAGVVVMYLEWKYLMLGTLADVGGFPYFDTQHFFTIGLTMSKFVMEHYVKPLILGISFCADYTRPSLPDARLHDPLAWLSAILLLGIFGISIVAAIRNKSRMGLYGALFFLLLLPVLNIFPRLEVIGAERFLYLPSVGYCLAMGYLFEKVSRFHKLGAAAAAIGMLLVWYGGEHSSETRLGKPKNRSGKQPSAMLPRARVHGMGWEPF